MEGLHLGTLNDKVHITNPAPNGSDINEEHTSPPTGINGLFKAVISSPGPIVSFSRLNSKGVFRRHATDDISGKHLMQQVADQLPELELGNVEQFTIPGNKSQVFFFKKQEPPQEQSQSIQFARKLATVGISLPTYLTLYTKENEERMKRKGTYGQRIQ
ncbi:hypothetical protein OS493_006746 [Desmophyllum pertusum]|uniref:Uncharacterized protein n=1 Tax=Desmophyllum pertusum TaxID=174260 RepID=A0A9W9ZRR4_9CNID|nr:hypothetical protein OS493_006746 [Desmophyllum pertusum]